MAKDRYGRHICTKDDPWTPDKAEQAIHPDSIHLNLYSDYGWYEGGDEERRRCPHCGREC